VVVRKSFAQRAPLARVVRDELLLGERSRKAIHLGPLQVCKDLLAKANGVQVTQWRMEERREVIRVFPGDDARTT